MLPFFFIIRQKKKEERVRFSFFKFKTEFLRFLVNYLDTINNIIKKMARKAKNCKANIIVKKLSRNKFNLQFLAILKMNDYIRAITNILGIKINIIIENNKSDTQYTEKTVAYYKLQNGYTLYIREKESYSIFDMYIIARELRIMWQFNKNFEYYFYGYRLNGMTEEQYESHISNIDADVFAYLIIKNNYQKEIKRNYKYISSELKFRKLLNMSESKGKYLK